MIDRKKFQLTNAVLWWYVTADEYLECPSLSEGALENAWIQADCEDEARSALCGVSAFDPSIGIEPTPDQLRSTVGR